MGETGGGFLLFIHVQKPEQEHTGPCLEKAKAKYASLACIHRLQFSS